MTSAGHVVVVDDDPGALLINVTSACPKRQPGRKTRARACTHRPPSEARVPLNPAFPVPVSRLTVSALAVLALAVLGVGDRCSVTKAMLEIL